MKRSTMVCVVCLLLIGSARGQEAGVLAELNTYYDSTRIKSGNTPAAIVVTRNGEILLERYEAGAYAGLHVPVDANALFAITSASKSYAAALLMSLQKDGLLSLNDPVGKFLPAFQTRGKGLFDRREVLVRHIASHTSGSSISKATYDWSDTPPDLEWVQIDTAPGGVWDYSTIGMHLLQRTIEAATGKKYQIALRERILRPLGLKGTHFVFDGESGLPVLPGRFDTERDSPEIYYWAHELHLAAAGIHTTARDLNRFCQMMISDGTFEGHHYFNAEDRQLVWAQHTRRPSDDANYGILWWLFPEEGGYVMSGAGRSLSTVLVRGRRGGECFAGCRQGQLAQIVQGGQD